ncbi:DRTGG domain-containing protein [Clostridium senegalense]|uniref:DRTGG domain-containing protein n=1 Tax=Clostridium senegalense TaxID=1465809 RepID=UPI001C0FEEEB|nr:DRTGG domain-containing protein [Clostridium senegalense]MBU5226422.1 CBS domain-containing protein [Clostridium senegalense]
MSKHEEIIKFILSLDIGTKISVRGISNGLGVSEGTAYRAIKECETIGIVNTIPRVGTVRVEKLEKRHIDKLTFKDVVAIVEGTILGGNAGLERTLERFVIGAMEVESIHKYIDADCLFIVGNRELAQKLALEKQCAVLVTGGFECSDRIKELANKNGLPLISSTYDTFTVASMINKALFENNIKKDIILVEDIMGNSPTCLSSGDTIKTLKKLVRETGHERYPVIDNEARVVGIVTLADIPNDTNDDDVIDTIMVKKPIVVMPTTTLAYAAHIMAWEGIKLCPVVNRNKLVGIISREDVIKAMQIAIRQPHVGETMDDLIIKNFKFEPTSKDKVHFWGEIIPEMLDSIGTASWNALNMLLSTMGTMALRQNNVNANIAIDSFSSYFMKPVQMGRVIDIYAEVVDVGRYYSKVDISIYNSDKLLIAKAMLSAKMLKK